MDRTAMFQRACLSNWFPKLARSGVDVPRTEIVTTKVELWRRLDPKEHVPRGYRTFIDELLDAAQRVGGLPCFLRTGHGSGKHDWMDTCFLALNEDEEMMAAVEGRPCAENGSVMRHVQALVEWSESVDMIGLPTNVWVVRELLPLLSTFTTYNNMPVAREYRIFIENGRRCCGHPYWPKEAVERGNPPDSDWEAKYEQLFSLTLSELAALERVGDIVAKMFANDGAWSLDVAQHEDGRWFAIDMAPAAVSWHWPGCPHERRWGVSGEVVTEEGANQ